MLQNVSQKLVLITEGNKGWDCNKTECLAILKPKIYTFSEKNPNRMLFGITCVYLSQYHDWIWPTEDFKITRGSLYGFSSVPLRYILCPGS